MPISLAASSHSQNGLVPIFEFSPVPVPVNPRRQTIRTVQEIQTTTFPLTVHRGEREAILRADVLLTSSKGKRGARASRHEACFGLRIEFNSNGHWNQPLAKRPVSALKVPSMLQHSL
jgi:hypothetical protein